MAAKSLFYRPFDLLCVCWFLLHIPTTVLVDSQSVFPPEWYPSWAKELLQWHITTNGDHLVKENPSWFLGMVYCECFLQLPFFFMAAWAFAWGQSWIRIPTIIYTSHACTTMVPILMDILSVPGREKLALIYLPYFIMPFLILCKMVRYQVPFALQKKKKVG